MIIGNYYRVEVLSKKNSEFSFRGYWRQWSLLLERISSELDESPLVE